MPIVDDLSMRLWPLHEHSYADIATGSLARGSSARSEQLLAVGHGDIP